MPLHLIGEQLLFIVGVLVGIGVLVRIIWYWVGPRITKQVQVLFITPLQETHRTLTQNGNKDPENPTILDRVGGVEGTLAEIQEYQSVMKAEVAGMKKTLNKISSTVKANASQFQAHVEWANETAAEHGIPIAPTKGQK